MAERKQMVLDANILIRACLGVRVCALIADCASEVDFHVAEANAAETAGYINELATRRGLDPQICKDAFLSLMEVVQVAWIEQRGVLCLNRWPLCVGGPPAERQSNEGVEIATPEGSPPKAGRLANRSVQKRLSGHIPTKNNAHTPKRKNKIYWRQRKDL